MEARARQRESLRLRGRCLAFEKDCNEYYYEWSLNMKCILIIPTNLPEAQPPRKRDEAAFYFCFSETGNENNDTLDYMILLYQLQLFLVD